MAEDRARQGAPPQAGTVEVDAVCERCGTVNPEETLLCKSCGNNLRDQRARRLSSVRNYDDLAPSQPKTRWLTHLLTVFGLLIILWTALNVGRVENWLVSAQNPVAFTGEEFYTGPAASTFDRMAAELERNPISQGHVNQAMSQPANPEGYEGRFAIMRRGLTGPEYLGQALVLKDGDDLLFVARLEEGMEIRGLAQLDANGVAQAGEIGIRFGKEHTPAQGFAQRTAQLGYLLYGVTAYSGGGYEAVAYAIPGTAPQRPQQQR